MKKTLTLSTIAISCSLAFAAQAETTLFKNVDVFNGTEDKLYEDHHVLVVDNKIAQISSTEITATDVTVIDGQGKTLMPGLIDGHAHIMINYNFSDIETNKDLTDISIHSVQVVERYLNDGFTTVRDMGGPAFGLTREIEAGNVEGPRIYPSGAFISQTSGHGDFRDRNDAGFSPKTAGDLSNFERMGIGAVADGVPEVMTATRVNLRNGATQIKIMAGGGGSSRFDPIDTVQYSVEETCAIVEAAKDWNTYVAAHTFNDRSVNRLLDCGVKTFEHGFFINDDTMKRIAKEGGYVVPQMWGLSPDLAKNPLMPAAKLPMVAKLQEEYGDYGQRLIKNNVKVVFASDYVGADADAERARRYEIYWRTQAFGSNFEVLKQMTSIAGEMLAMSGPRGTTQGKLGVIEKGAVADVILVEGNPLEDMSVIGATEKWFDADPEYKEIETIKLVMKDGKIYRNKL
ncbi:amidohydrolase [Vibrio sp. UCD-FRSSP16_10]|uniref:metal-dependent hydrolase family protein n=1 Tax=unclassified Vibrio TaxID=2614977 RepID=UPI000800EFC0|nr:MULTISPECIES: amidohydrolase family protein [unclassified Vibrio]OBT12157.1 amidohydrolase [Vibrio sp. UCD-FRSSP16_30]OBT20488.1 amidohydrolase [Vibrio sp. UCD-FRSSP16_10]